MSAVAPSPSSSTLVSSATIFVKGDQLRYFISIFVFLGISTFAFIYNLIFKGFATIHFLVSGFPSAASVQRHRSEFKP